LPVASDDKLLKLWSVNRRQFRASLKGHTNWVRDAAISRDDRLVVSGSDDKTVKVRSGPRRE